jgi:thiosulfate reductase cytochrome b subunit
MEAKMYLYPKWIRLWHITNALMFIILIVTGLSMQYTDKENPSYMLGFAKAVKWHNFSALILTVSYIIFIIGNAFAGNGKYYRIGKKNFWSDLMSQMRYYSYGMFRGEKHPFPVTMERKFNPLQKFTYVLAMYFGMPLVIISGIVLLFPEIALDSVFGMSGLVLNDVLHITTGFFLSIFMVIHIYTCTLGAKPTSLFKGMLSGYHESGDH